MSNNTESGLQVDEQSESALRYIDTLEVESLSPPLVAPGAALKEGASAAVNAASVVAFSDITNSQQKADVLNSTLFAQLVANAKYNRETDVINWYMCYCEVLDQIGWVVPGPPFNKLSGSSARFTLESTVLELLATTASQQEIAVMRAAIDALEQLPDRDRRVVIFETSSHSVTRGNFQIHTCRASGSVIHMNIEAFYFSTTEAVTRVLFFNFPRASTDMQQATQKCQLNMQRYSQFRDAIVQKLGDKTTQFVAELEI